MRKIQKHSLAAISGFMMLINAGAASSSTSHASAVFDWSTFTIAGYGLGMNPAPSYNLVGQTSNTTSSSSDWLNWSSDIANNASAFSVAASGTGIGSGSALAQRNASLSITGSGFLVISADYTLSAAINGISCLDYYCYDQNSATASVGFDLTNISSQGNHTSHAEPKISLGEVWQSSLTSDEKQGTLSIGVIVNDGDVLNFSSFVSAVARETAVLNPINLSYENAYGAITAVPVPGAVWLFASSLLGMAGLARRKETVVV